MMIIKKLIMKIFIKDFKRNLIYVFKNNNQMRRSILYYRNFLQTLLENLLMDFYNSFYYYNYYYNFKLAF